MGKFEGGTVNERQIENDKDRFGDFINRPVRISHQSSVLCFEQAKHGERCQHFCCMIAVLCSNIASYSSAKKDNDDLNK